MKNGTGVREPAIGDQSASVQSLHPVALESDHVRLEPLTLDHVPGLEQAAADGELWNLRVTYVPPPGAMHAYVETAFAMQASGASLPFAVRDKQADAIVGSTRYYDFHPDVPWVSIGYT